MSVVHLLLQLVDVTTGYVSNDETIEKALSPPFSPRKILRISAFCRGNGGIPRRPLLVSFPKGREFHN